MRQPANASKLLAFFNGEAADNKLFVFYQPPAVDQGDVDAEGWPGNEQPPELFFSQGSTTRLTTKCCVFVRAVERVEQVRSQPPEGVYLHGMFLDGAAFDKKESLLVESEPKKLFVSLPILFVSGLIKDESYKRRKELFGAHGPYECPVYKYRPRTDRFFIFFVTLKCTTEKNAKHWTLRGTALLTTDSASS